MSLSGSLLARSSRDGTMGASVENFGLKTVAEGVEDERTLELLLECGVDHAQGYAVGRPGPLEDVIRS